MILNSKTPQWGGTVFMMGSLLFLINKLNDMSRLFLSRPIPDVISGQNMLLIILGQVALIIGFVAYFWMYTQRVGRFGKNALRLFCGGGILLAVGHVSFMPLVVFEPFFIFVIIGLTAMLIGLILFGIANLRQPILGRWRWLPLATGLIGFIGFFMFRGEEITAVFLAFRTLFALGLFGLGLALWLEKPIRTGVV
jgi:hypothetical protein